jgi:hypothetical protein
MVVLHRVDLRTSSPALLFLSWNLMTLLSTLFPFPLRGRFLLLHFFSSYVFGDTNEGLRLLKTRFSFSLTKRMERRSWKKIQLMFKKNQNKACCLAEKMYLHLRRSFSREDCLRFNLYWWQVSLECCSTEPQERLCSNFDEETNSLCKLLVSFASLMNHKRSFCDYFYLTS